MTPRISVRRPRRARLACVAAVFALAVPLAAADENARAVSLEPLPDARWDRAAAAHLLRRAGLGGTPAEVDKLCALGRDAAVDYLVSYDKIAYTPPPPPIHASLAESPDRRALRQLSDEERRAVEEERRRLERRALEETRLWWIERLAESPRPLEEKLTLFWHGHFTSGAREVKNSVFMKDQNDLLRRLAGGSFRELLLGISRDRAMLVYLDGNRNNKQKPNENYARELLELFTLGVGNYSEDDVKSAARAFTGWGFDEDGFSFRARQHDEGVKRFLGRTGNFDGEQIIDIILEQPACARFLARGLLEAFVRPQPEKPLVEALARALRRNKYELRPTLRTLFRSEAFYHEQSRGTLIKSPVELLVGTARTLGVSLDALALAERAMSRMGQELMQPPNVKGWDGGTAWINTATLFDRYNAVGALVNGLGDSRPSREAQQRRRELANDEDGAANESMSSMAEMKRGAAEPRSRFEPSRQPAFDPTAWLDDAKSASAPEIVDFFAARLLAVPLPASKKEVLVAYLQGGRAPFDPKARNAAARIRTMIHLMCSTPEYQLY